MDAGAAGYTVVDTEVLRALLHTDPSPLVVDLRETVKYNQGHMPGAVSFPMKPGLWEKILKKARLKSLLGPDKARGIVFY